MSRLVAVVVALLFVAGGIYAGLAIVTRVETGAWKAPNASDLVQIVKREPKTWRFRRAMRSASAVVTHSLDHARSPKSIANPRRGGRGDPDSTP